MEFFNFCNEQSYHFFKWVTESGLVDVQELVAEAMQRVETNDGFKLGMSVTSCAHQELSELLSELIVEQTGYPVEENHIGNVGPRIESLTEPEPLTNLALAQINVWAVAEALLRREGKWAPSHEPPEVV